jgi:hypothetical protein
MNELEALAERVEKAEGPDRELDARIWCVVGVGSPWNAENCWLAATVRPPEMETSGIDLSGWLDRCPEMAADLAKSYNVPAYTASIDAAMTLVPEGYPARQVGSTDDGRGYAAVAGNDMHMMAEDPEEFFAEGNSATPALALCAAALRARALAPAMPV